MPNKPVSPMDHSDFVAIGEMIPDLIQEIRYYTSFNFVGARVRGYEEPVALLTREAAEALKKVSDDVISKGYRLKIFDAYRPQMAVDHFVAWASDIEDTRMKQYFYPDVNKAILFDIGFIARRSGHTRGSTVDLTLFDMNTQKEVDMGAPFDYFGNISRADTTEGLTEAQLANRKILADAMLNNGFKPLDSEWWHFTLRNEPYPDTYFNFPVRKL